MNTRVVIGVVVVIVIVIIIIAIVAALAQDPVINDNNDVENNNNELVDQVIGELPHEMTVGQRTIVFDRQTVEQLPRGEYAQREVPLSMRANEDPIEYIERFLEMQVGEEFIQDQPEFFDYEVSFYRFDSQIEDENLGRGVSAYVRVTNIPDDSVGGAEGRIDFIVQNNNWMADWYGERVFCRRPAPGNWQPADELCV
jgi:hypothetical protein